MARHHTADQACNWIENKTVILFARGFLLTAGLLCLVLLAAPAVAGLLLPSAPGIQVINPDEVLRDHTAQLSTGDLAFRESSGALVRLIVDIDDPEIRNRGDGSFHPASEAAVYEALQELPSAYLQALRVEIFLLPYPRAGRLSSSADSRAIYLTPGVRDYDANQVAFLVSHEIGHTFQRHFMPDSMAGSWAEWAALRGVTDSSVFHENAVHADRPHEIFAEDFRVLFGGAAARGDGSIENPRLQPPDSVPGLRAFYERLAGGTATPAVATLGIWPNPARAGQLLTLRLAESRTSPSTDPTASLIDVSGRVVADMVFRPAGGGTYAAALGSAGGDGDRPTAGAYWLRIQAGSGGRVQVIPIRVVR